MVSASVSGMHGWGNQCSPSLLGALGLSLRHGEGLRALFYSAAEDLPFTGPWRRIRSAPRWVTM